MEIGQIIKSLRIAQNLTQKQVGELTQLSERGIQNYELNLRKPTSEALVALADFFNVPVDYLLGRGLYANAEWLDNSKNMQLVLEYLSKLDFSTLSQEKRECYKNIYKNFLEVLKSNIPIYEKIFHLSFFVKDIEINDNDIKLRLKF